MSFQYNTVTVNGEVFNCYSKMSLYNFLIYLEFDIRNIVVEYNQEIVSLNNLDQIFLNQGDKLEVVTIVGGG
uniref:Thiamine biosynthesis protein n=1 Tax=Hypnea pseudomusciformis TaxID=1545697 RepID=UPI0027DA7A48|nr:Thiamine biosynthesis protein [Hypnea pseudomusciformis]WCH55218.1 Thiamine biosynthesis protein [Hypnea pseudomusciformis]WCH55617.1 Thiamine biosynthesis protein [Hypnea pseudomusciformis]WCH56811.1 Thiamine biosynthesis protein [Hypnea pseudomusciformis]